MNKGIRWTLKSQDINRKVADDFQRQRLKVKSQADIRNYTIGGFKGKVFFRIMAPSIKLKLDAIN